MLVKKVEEEPGPLRRGCALRNLPSGEQSARRGEGCLDKELWAVSHRKQSSRERITPGEVTYDPGHDVRVRHCDRACPNKCAPGSSDTSCGTLFLHQSHSQKLRRIDGCYVEEKAGKRSTEHLTPVISQW